MPSGGILDLFIAEVAIDPPETGPGAFVAETGGRPCFSDDLDRGQRARRAKWYGLDWNYRDYTRHTDAQKCGR